MGNLVGNPSRVIDILFSFDHCLSRMKSALLTAKSQLPLPKDSYVYQILPVEGHIAAISSDDSLRLLDPVTLRAAPHADFGNVHAGVTSIQAAKHTSHLLVTAGRDSKISGWDLRSRSLTTSFVNSIAFARCPGLEKHTSNSRVIG